MLHATWPMLLNGKDRDAEMAANIRSPARTVVRRSAINDRYGDFSEAARLHSVCWPSARLGSLSF